jgi:predicted tellurium resistance membrane protein TerC
MSSNNSSSSSGIGFPGLLTVLFIGLKLTGHITWSWWWVLSPMWISLLIGLTVLAIVFIIALVNGWFK